MTYIPSEDLTILEVNTHTHAHASEQLIISINIKEM